MEAIGYSLDYKQMGIRVRAGREKFGLSREGLAEIVDLSPFYIGQIERGERKMSLDTLYKVSCSLNISTDILLKDHNSFLENNYIEELLEDSYKEEADETIKELLALLSGSSKDIIELIKEISKLIVPFLNK